MSDIVRLPLYGQLREHVSYSELRLFRSCEWRWFLTNVAGLRQPERSLAMEFGSAIHSTLELAFAPGERPSLGSLAESFSSAFEKGLEGLEIDPSDLPERDRLREIGPTIVRDALACPDLQGIVPLRNELRLEEPIARTDGLDVKFKGYVDFIFVKKLAKKRVIYIADFKTCTWGWPYDKLSDPEVCAQILLYKHFFCKLTGAPPRDVSAAFILLKKTPRPGDATVQVAKIPAGPKVLEGAMDFLQGSITKMHGYSYQKNRGSCVREWIDSKTKEPRSAKCPFYQTENCT